MADVQNRVTDLENEIKVLKNEIKAILLDIREQYLNVENPFSGATLVGTGDSNPTTHMAAPAVVSGPAAATSGVGSPLAGSLLSGIVSSPSTEFIAEDESKASDAASAPSPKLSAGKETSAKMRKSENKEANDSLPTPGTEYDAEEEPLPSKRERDRKAHTVPMPSLGPYLEDAELLLEVDGHGKKATSRKDVKQGYRNSKESDAGVNLITIAGLSKWVDESTEKIGRERTEVMVEACYMVGHLSSELKDLLVKLVHLAQSDEPRRGRVTTRDYLGVIAQLDSLLGYGSESEAALLTILTDNKESRHG